MENYKNIRIYKICINIFYKENFKYDFLYEIEGVQKVEFIYNCFNIIIIKEIENLDKIIVSLIDRNMKISYIISEEGNLEMVFLKLIGRKLRDQR